MPRLIITQGPSTGREITLSMDMLVMGRSAGLDLTLEGSNVSRKHACLARSGNGFYIEDLGSSNGTFINNHRISGRTQVQHGDVIRIGSHMLRFEEHPTAAGIAAGPQLTIQRQTVALASNTEIFRENAGHKLQAVLDMAHHLVNSLDPENLLQRMVEPLLRLFPHADRVLVISFKGGEPIVRVNRDRKGRTSGTPAFSRSVLQKVFEEGTAVLAEDTQSLEANVTLQALGIRSVVCVPLRAHGRPVFGAVQLDRLQFGHPFTSEDLYLLTAVALQVAAVLENANLHQELLTQERFQRDLAMAREIQEGFLPREVPRVANGAVDLFAELHPAQEVSGDFYDFLALDDTRVAFTVADVSGKGMPAALFMTMIRALWRQIAPHCSGPAEIFEQLNEAVARDNPKFMYVTMLLGIYDSATHKCVLARAGHPPPLLRRADGVCEEIKAPRGALIGITAPCPPFGDVTLDLSPGDTVIFYTDGVTEAADSSTKNMFGHHRLLCTVTDLAKQSTLQEWGTQIRKKVDSFVQGAGPQDDVTLLFLRRPS